jgi:phosphoglucomutase
MDVKNYLKWKEFTNLEPKMKKQLEAMSESELEDAFYRNIEFGTAGMRGLIGPGINRINHYVVAKASDVFAKYLLSEFEDVKTRGVVIAHDNRHYSKEFCLVSANVFAKNGIKVYIFDDLRPTPMLSYSVRKLNACGGVVITASHNPKEYNGYKVYDETGCQLIPSKIEKLLKFYEGSEIYTFEDFSGHYDNIITLSQDIDEEYYNDVEKVRINKFADTHDLKIVYTPQHGTGYKGVKTLLSREGYNLILVESQCTSDPDFTNTLSPNPEEAKAYEEAIKIATKNDADLVLCTDPDADRIGVAVKKDGGYILLNGNQTGALMIEYILSQKKKLGLLPENSIIYNTIVTSNSGAKVANKYGVQVKSLLTGFKYIGEQIKLSLENNGPTYVFGYEESYGSLISPIARDKDALQACVLISEMTLYYKKLGMTLYDALIKLYDEIGYFVEKQVSVNFKGSEGFAKIASIMTGLRNNDLTTIGGLKVVTIEDYDRSIIKQGTKVGKLDLPKSDVLKYTLEDGGFIAIRPSGTETKCKFYYNFVGSSFEDAQQKIDNCINSINGIIK